MQFQNVFEPIMNYGNVLCTQNYVYAQKISCLAME